MRVLVQEDYAAGDPAPEGYLAWHEWAEVQYNAGLRQAACGRCGKWWFPQEISQLVDVATMQSRKGPVRVETPVCKFCSDRKPHG